MSLFNTALRQFKVKVSAVEMCSNEYHFSVANDSVCFLIFCDRVSLHVVQSSTVRYPCFLLCVCTAALGGLKFNKNFGKNQ